MLEKPSVCIPNTLAEQFGDLARETEHDIYTIFYQDLNSFGHTLKNVTPDIVVIDIRENECDALDFCESIKKYDVLKDAFIIVIANNIDIETKLKCYDAGVQDYFCDPLHFGEIRAKIAKAFTYIEQAHELKKRLATAAETAREVITISDEQVIIIEYFESIANSTSYDSLSKKIFRAMQSYKLSTSLQIRSKGESHSYADSETQQIVNPLELELFDLMKDEGRILELGRRLMINYEGISLLIKNPPQDPEKLGRFRDHLAVILRGAETKIANIEMHDSNQKHYETVKSLKELITGKLNHLDEQQQKFKMASIKVNEDLLDQINTGFLVLGLNETQEEHLMNLVQNTLQISMGLFDAHMDDDSILSDIVSNLEEMLRECETSLNINNTEESDELFSSSGVIFL